MWGSRQGLSRARASGLYRMRVVITGGSKGIGRACVEAFAKAGAQVLFTFNSASQDQVEAVEAAYGEIVKGAALDQGNFASVRAFAEVVSNWCDGEPLDVLVNNAALGSVTVENYSDGNEGNTCEGCKAARGGSIDDAVAVRAREDEAMLKVNALGPVWVTEALIPFMRKKPSQKTPNPRSTTVFIGSVGGGSQSVFHPYRVSDAMSKAALSYAVKCFAAKHVHDELDFLMLSPGATHTAMFQASTLEGMNDAERNEFTARLPKKRLIDPAEVAEAVLWLATARSSRMFHGGVLDASQGLAVRPGLLSEWSASSGMSN
ncbi:unnamed protein product [Chrysoparadoxa australica]